MSDSIFYGLADLVIAPLNTNVVPVGLMVTRNMFSNTPYGNPRACVDTSSGDVVVAGMRDVSITANAFSNATVGRSTSATITVGVNGTANATSIPPACARVCRKGQVAALGQT